MGTTVGPVTVKHISVVLLTPDSVEFKFGLENTQQSEYTWVYRAPWRFLTSEQAPF